ncbi:MAG: DMT family transporter [Patescibacteria group bacterium]
MTAVLGFLILKEKVTTKKIFFITLSFIGVIIISINDFSNFSLGQGEILALMSVFFVSLSIIFRKYQTKLLNNVEITQILLFIAFIFMFITSLFMKEGLPINNWNWNGFFIVSIAGLANVLMIFFTNYGFEHIKTSIAANILTLEMFFAVLIGLMFYREIPNLKEIFGGILILFSVIQMNKLE